MEAKPITECCSSPFSKREHICFGISPFNSYFTESRIESLARWGAKEFRSMHFFVPDAPTIFTLEALGYTPEKAAWKARRQCQYLHNKISKAVAKLGFFPDEVSKMILNWETLTRNKDFLDLSAVVHQRFQCDSEFQEACLDATSWVLEGKLPPGADVSEQQRFHAVKYLLAEIPLFIDSAGIAGLSSSVFAYHQHVPFIERLMAGTYSIKRSAEQGFIVLKAPEVSSALSSSANPSL